MARSIVHTHIALEMEQEGETSPSRICKFHNDVRDVGKIPKMLQELGYEKRPKYFGTQVTYEGSEPMLHVQFYIFTRSPLEEFLRSRRSMQPSFQDAPSMLEFLMLLSKLTWLLVRAISSSWMEQSIPIFPNELVDLSTSIGILYSI
jgi:hypothetical protein